MALLVAGCWLLVAGGELIELWARSFAFPAIFDFEGVVRHNLLAPNLKNDATETLKRINGLFTSRIL